MESGQTGSYFDFLNLDNASNLDNGGAFSSPDVEQNLSTFTLGNGEPFLSPGVGQNASTFNTPTNDFYRLCSNGNFPPEQPMSAIPRRSSWAHILKPAQGTAPTPQSNAPTFQVGSTSPESQFPVPAPQSKAPTVQVGSNPPESASPETAPPPAKRKCRISKKSDTETPEDPEKRLKFLERNRIAASKCREKKKIQQRLMEQRSAALEKENAELRAKIDALTADVQNTQNILITHAKCNDPNIDCWFRRKAEQLANGNMQV
ncbi:uncharacterized protein C8A04DRAFT_28539 [Dichotomopilus funicola]|uniref:BZIP domain-containing protein n=1 Tax=Dichotomopilus funicola TaxID=1934379 RepID=A0AAN6V2Y2_9PEZI|nr:hypothetical protein C8A04DRAFT_28539 [Dichotomopilus funicola]